MTTESRITLLAAFTTLMALPGTRPVYANTTLLDDDGCLLCVEDCAQVFDPSATCQSANCGTIGVCPGDGGACDFDIGNDEDEEIFCG